jgi:hypothetical protein
VVVNARLAAVEWRFERRSRGREGDDERGRE